MDPDIELWNLDVVDSMYPDAVLGQGAEDAANADKPKKKKKKSKKANDNFHVDSVLSLAANRQHRNLLASSSADKTIKLWDLNTTKCAKSYTYHTDKVCSVAWHPVESTVLLSGSYDRTVVAADMRAPEAKAPRWGVESDVEAVRWNPHDPNFFYVCIFRDLNGALADSIRSPPRTAWFTTMTHAWHPQTHRSQNLFGYSKPMTNLSPLSTSTQLSPVSW
jgi:periodic tryptophan protein 1